MTSAEASGNGSRSAPDQPEPLRPPARRRRASARAREVWTRRPNVFAFLVLGSLILALGVAAWSTGFKNNFWPNFLLNSAGDLIGGMTVLFLIEPIVRQAAALQIRQHPRLDYGWFLRRVGEARSQVRILDTFSGLFGADRDGVIRALRDAALHGVDIRVLLMSPSTDASALREFQLRQSQPGLWINDLIQANIADFRLVEAAILAIGNGQQHGRLELRLYTVAAPFSLYGWDERALFAFLPPHAFSDQSAQLEITDQSQLGREALDHFEAVWLDAQPIPQLLPIQVVDEQATRDLLVRFVHANNATYLVSKRIDAAIRANPALRVRFGDQNTMFQPEIVPLDDPQQQQLHPEFYNKYARRPDASFHVLRPLTDDTGAPTDRPKEHDSLPTRTLMDLIGQSQSTIRILDTSSSLMAEAGPAFARAVGAAMKRRVKVQVLLLAPTTQAAQDRAAEIQDPLFDTRIEENVRELRRLGHMMAGDGLVADGLEVRLYDRLPECSVHQVDDRLMVAFLPYQRRTSRVKHFEIGQDASLGQFAARQFDAKWEAARPLEGMRYADLTTETDTKHLLLRIWDAGAQRYLASNRIEGLIAEAGAARGGHARAPELRMVVEDRPGEEFVPSEPLIDASPEGRLATEAFVEIFGVKPDAPVRRLDVANGQAVPFVPRPTPPGDDPL